MSVSFGVERAARIAGIALVIWALFTFVVVPLGSALHVAFFRSGRFAFTEVVAELAGSRRVRTALWNTVWMTLASTVTVTVVGVLQVAVLEYFRVRGRSILLVGFAVPLVFGSIVAAAGYRFTYGPGGTVTLLASRIYPGIDPNWFQGWFGVLYAHTFLLTGFHFLFLRAAIRRVDFSIVEAARNLGASGASVLARVVLPVIRPTLLAVTLLTVYVAIGSFAAPQILGGRDFYMLSQVILTLNSLRRQDMAALLAILLGLIVMALILLSQHFEARGAYVGGAKTPTPMRLQRVSNPLANVALHAASYLLWAVYVAPVIVVVIFSFAPAATIGVEALPSTLTLKNYLRVLGGGAALEPFLNSIRMSALAVVAALGITTFSVPLMLRHRNWLTRGLDLGFFLPWVLPSILIAIGLIAAFDTPNVLVGGRVLLGSFSILLIGYSIVILPLTVRFMRAAFAGLDPAYDEAARSMGAGALYRFRRITLPLVAPTAILVAGLAFNDLMTEYPLSAFLYNVNNRPLSIAIVDGARSPDPEQEAINLVYATLIMAFSLVVIRLADRIGLGKGPATIRL